MRYLLLLLSLLFISCSSPDSRTTQIKHVGVIVWRERPKADYGGETFLIYDKGQYKMAHVTSKGLIWKITDITLEDCKQ